MVKKLTERERFAGWFERTRRADWYRRYPDELFHENWSLGSKEAKWEGWQASARVKRSPSKSSGAL